MSLPLQFHPAVQEEIEDAHDWYEHRRAGLGREFLDELEGLFAEITENPARYGFAKADIREGLLKRFPYAIYYRAFSNRIRILSVFHTSRNPLHWRSRN